LAYQVIARKYRPQAFEELVGQAHVTQTLQNALSSDRFPHAILFNGPRGTGKTTSARIIAKTLLCENPKDHSPCQVCKNCEDVQASRHLDLYEIDGASNNGVDDIRDLRETIGYMPTSGKFKIYIIDEVHMLSTSAFNALLKTLEEPPAHVIFMFATTEAQKIPATILSRCQRFDLRMLSLNEIKNHLAKICDSEKIGFEDAALWMLAKQAKGSIRDSLTLLDQVISFGPDKVAQKTVMDVLGLSDRSLLFNALRAIAGQDKFLMLETTQSLVDSGYDPLLFLEEFMEILRHALMVRSGVHKKMALEIPINEVEDLEEIVKRFREEEIQFLFDITLHGTQRVSYSRDMPTAFEMHMFKLLLAPRLTSTESVEVPAAVAEPQSPLPQASAKTETAPTTEPLSTPSQSPVASQKTAASPQTSPAPAQSKKDREPTPQQAEPPGQAMATAAPTANPQFQAAVATETSETLGASEASPSTDAVAPPVRTTEAPVDGPIDKNWDLFVTKVKASNGFLGALLEHTSIYQEDEKTLTLGLPPKMNFLLDKLQDPKNLERTQKFLQSLWRDSREVEISVLGKKESLQAPSPKAKMEQMAVQKKEADQNSVESHPLVKATQNMFTGKITKIIENPRRTP